MATVTDDLRTEEQAMVRMARGTFPITREVGVTVAAAGIKTYPTDPIDTTNYKRILSRLTHDATVTSGKFTIEFSDTEDFTDITFFETLDVDVTTNPSMVKMGANAGADATHYCAEMDVESMDNYMRARVRNDTAGERTFTLNIKAKVM